MGILKFGVIGFMIMCPFIYISFVLAQGDIYEYQQLTYIEKAIEEASHDAAFVMKTYSESAYNSLDEFSIVVPRDDVVQVFFDSLSFRDFRYSKADFPMLVFIEYDGVIVYNPRADVYYPKVYYSRDQGAFIEYVNLAHEVQTLEKTTLLDMGSKVDSYLAESIILKTLEETLNRSAISLGIAKDLVFELPESDHNFYSAAVNDLSFIAFYSNTEYYGLGDIHIFEIKPSGIMKMKVLLPIDI